MEKQVIRVKTKSMLEGLKKVAYVKDGSLDFLNGVIIEVENGQCKILKTNIIDTVVYNIEVDTVPNNNSFKAIIKDHKQMNKAIKFMKKDTLEISIYGENIKITDGKKTMQFINDYRDIELPKLDIIENHKYNREKFIYRIEQIDYAIGNKNDARVNTINFTEDIIFTLDGYRLALSKDKDLKIENKFNITEDSLNTLKKVLKTSKTENIDINICKNIIEFTTKNTSIIIKKSEVEMFDYKRIIRENHDNIININTEDLLDSLKYLESFNKARGNKKKDARANALRVEPVDEDKINLKFNNNDGIFESLLNIPGHNLDFAFGLNIHYLLDAIKKVEDNIVHLGLNSKLDPVIVETENNFLHLVLPIRLDY